MVGLTGLYQCINRLLGRWKRRRGQEEKGKEAVAKEEDAASKEDEAVVVRSSRSTARGGQQCRDAGSHLLWHYSRYVTDKAVNRVFDVMSMYVRIFFEESPAGDSFSPREETRAIHCLRAIPSPRGGDETSAHVGRRIEATRHASKRRRLGACPSPGAKRFGKRPG
ncbi:hypothetical protein GW17_00021777 [Ensete ventricosum]|nr:hypothetical protein GW17_00021777 [Ensete ventricosum]